MRADGSTDRVRDVVYRTRFDAGQPCLNLLATLGRRGGVPVERVPTAPDLATWLVDVGVLAAQPRVGERHLRQVRRLRDAIYSVIDATRHSRTPDPDAIVVLNTIAAHPTPAPRLARDGQTATHHSDGPVEAALAVLARDAVDLVTGADLARVRECAAPECRMLFLDNSHGSRRRWCSMSRCGNRAKARTHAANRRQSS